LPPKTYVTYGVSLSPEQRRLYDRVLAEGVIEFDDFRVLTPLQISRLLRCQQITGGFVPTGEESTTRALKDNPKLKLLLDVVSDAQSKTIVWARFQPEIRAIVSALRETYGHESVVEYHGSVTTSQRRESARAFQGDGDVRFFVGQQASGIGIDLYAAEVVYYYSNDFSYEHRYQTEDRAHRIGLVHPVLYVDLVAYDTYDERVRQVLEQARSVADEILEDKKREKVCRQK
jgi:SNF2 family DNA or RNA helicase